MARPDGQRAELIEGEAPVRVMAGHMLDPVQLGFLIRISRFLPGPGPLEGDPAGVQDLPQPFPADPGAPRVQVSGQLAQAPVRERQAQLFRAGGGRRDDELDVLVIDQAGTASRSLRVQRGQALRVEGVDHVPADPDRPVLAAPHDLLQPAALLITEPPRPHRLSHHFSRHPIPSSQDRV